VYAQQQVQQLRKMVPVAGTGRQACQLDQRSAAVWIHCDRNMIQIKALAMIDELNITGF